jgi:hypothetical protein
MGLVLRAEQDGRDQKTRKNEEYIDSDATESGRSIMSKVAKRCVVIQDYEANGERPDSIEFNNSSHAFAPWC